MNRLQFEWSTSATYLHLNYGYKLIWRETIALHNNNSCSLIKAWSAPKSILRTMRMLIIVKQLTLYINHDPTGGKNEETKYVYATLVINTFIYVVHWDLSINDEIRSFGRLADWLVARLLGISLATLLHAPICKYFFSCCCNWAQQQSNGKSIFLNLCVPNRTNPSYNEIFLARSGLKIRGENEVPPDEKLGYEGISG